MDASDGASFGAAAGCADRPLRAGHFEFFVEAGVKAFAEAHRELKYAIIRGEHHDVARRVEDRRTYLTVLQVALH